MSFDGDASLIPIHTSTRVILSNLLRSWVEHKEAELYIFYNNVHPEDSENLQWADQTRKILDNAIADLYQIDSV